MFDLNDHMAASSYTPADEADAPETTETVVDSSNSETDEGRTDYGEIGSLTPEEVKAGYLRDADYRKKTSEVAREREAVQKEKEELEQLRSQLGNTHDITNNERLTEAIRQKDLNAIADILKPEDNLDKHLMALREEENELATPLDILARQLRQSQEARANLEGQVGQMNGYLNVLLRNEVGKQMAEAEQLYAKRGLSEHFNEKQIMEELGRTDKPFSDRVVLSIADDLNRDRLLQVEHQLGVEEGKAIADKRDRVASPSTTGKTGSVAEVTGGQSDEERTAAIVKKIEGNWRKKGWL